MFWLESQSWLQSFLKSASLLTLKPQWTRYGVPSTPRMLFCYVSSFEDSKLGCSFGDFCSTSYQQIPARMHQWKKVKALVAQSCPTLCDSMDCSPPGSSVHGILQARILEWAAIPFSRRSSPPRDQTPVSCIGRRILYLLSLQESMCQQRCKRVGVVGGGQATPEEAVSGCAFPHHSVGSSLFLCHVQGLRSKGGLTRGFIPVIQRILASTTVQFVSQRGSGNPLTVLMCGIDSLVWCFLTLCLTVLMPYKLFFNRGLFMKYKNALLTQWSAF